MFRTIDSGSTQTVLPTLWPADIAAIAACPSSTGACYVGAGYTVTCPARVNHTTIVDIVAASTDDGASWQTRLGDDIFYYRIAIGDNGQLWASTVHLYWKPLPQDMLLRYAGALLNVSPVTSPAEKLGPKAYPNPTMGVVSLAHEAGSLVRVYDSTGRQ